MAASANPSGNNQQESSRNGNGAAANDGGSAPHENSAVAATQAALRHNPGISVEWTTDEQSLLEELLTKYASERNIVRYAKIAMELKDKTVRDVALRCRWMNKKENGKRRKEDHSSTRKNKDKKEKGADPMAKSAPHATNRSSGPPYAQPVISMDSDDGISYKDIGGVTGELLEQNAHALDQISANFAAFKEVVNVNTTSVGLILGSNLIVFCNRFKAEATEAVEEALADDVADGNLPPLRNLIVFCNKFKAEATEAVEEALADDVADGDRRC
ncbi:hypothetical protein RHGRI_036080 [Rhododendron griersonianum]|uniref:Myb-like domain-containing protein n=1 Tax=Rhododendron griersonianum TaxID=479676 RepID=A0AAV6HQS4_9ERIC|nr:hypothetical protein RHGRI_036080 [Rhododendron griersonianum]